MTSSPDGKPTNVRFGVLGFCCVLSAITYLDRVCFGTVFPIIKREFELSEAERGYLFGAFTLAYSVFEIPSGWLGDRFGPRKTLIRVVLWWSCFTALTGAIHPSAGTVTLFGVTLSIAFLSLLTVRFLFGMGEAGAYPNIARAFHNWFPYTERGTAKGWVWWAGRLAGGLTPFVVLLLIHDPGDASDESATWRHIFWVFGGIGAVWCLLFWLWFRDHPHQKASVNRAELDYIRGSDTSHGTTKLHVPWVKIFTNGNLWLLCLMYFSMSYGWYFNITYLPGFLNEQFGLTSGDKFTEQWWTVAVMQGLPLLLGSCACLIGGVLTDRFIRRTGNRVWGRRIFGLLGHGACAACYFTAMYLIWSHPDRSTRSLGIAWSFVLAIGFASFFNDMAMGSAWASCLDIGGRYSGIVAGFMNTLGNLGGFAANVLTGLILQHYVGATPQGTPEYFRATQPAWIVNMAIFGTVYVIAVLMWIRFDPTKPVAPEPPPPMPPVPSIAGHIQSDVRGIREL